MVNIRFRVLYFPQPGVYHAPQVERAHYGWHENAPEVVSESLIS